ncbi:MAG: flagellar biosynthesis anti-sigma factor FlgM [Melioribacteraceae bacterium]
MQVKGISGNPLFVKPTQNAKAEATPSSPKDRIEISSEARDLAKLELSTERIEEIRSKLASGFYDTDEVLQKVSEKLSKEIIK